MNFSLGLVITKTFFIVDPTQYVPPRPLHPKKGTDPVSEMVCSSWILSRELRSTDQAVTY